jgi:hypothetical protein
VCSLILVLAAVQAPLECGMHASEAHGITFVAERPPPTALTCDAAREALIAAYGDGAWTASERGELTVHG